MKDRKYIKFIEVPVGKEFKYQGRLFLKTAESRGVSQEQPIKHRAYYEFDFECPIEEVK